MTVLYFTGTGNCLAVAKKIGGKVLSIPQEIGKESLVYEDDAIGIIYPVYCRYAPKMVRDFLVKAKFITPYLFIVGTYGNEDGACNYYIEKFAKENGIKFNYINTLLMVDNYLPAFEIEDQINKLSVKCTDYALDCIIKDINARKNFVAPVSGLDMQDSERAMQYIPKQDEGRECEEYIVQDKCVRCGICVKVCPAGNITLTDKPSFASKCETCYACIHACPQYNIRLPKVLSEVRWRHPEVSLEEIITANHRRNNEQ